MVRVILRRFSPPAAAAALAALAGCSALHTTPPPVAETPVVAGGPLDDLTPSRAPSGLDPRPPSVHVHHAARVASDVASALHEDAGVWLPDRMANAETDSWQEAWLRIDEAANLATLSILPMPDPDPVPVEQQTAAREDRDIGPGMLHLYVLNTGERFEIRMYDNRGRMRPEAVREAAWALRDQRLDRARSPSLRLLAMLYHVGQYYDAELQVVSGYRVRGVNASEGSRHGSGEACDIRIDGVSIQRLSSMIERRFANVGVGTYPTSRFVHIDTRDRTYYWIDYSGPGQRSRERSRSLDTVTDPSDDPTTQTVHITEAQLYVAPIPD